MNHSEEEFGLSDRPLRVLHVIPSVSPSQGGPSKAMETIEKALIASSICVTTVTTDDEGLGRRNAIDTRPDSVNGATRIYARKWFDFYKIAPGILPWLWCNERHFD